MTFYPMVPDDNPDRNYWRRLSHLDQGFSKYGKNGDSWNRRIGRVEGLTPMVE